MAKTTRNDPRSDADLVDACNHGNASEAAAAFAALYQRHKDYVIRIAMRFGADEAAALDVLQETFSYLLRRFPPTGAGLTLTAKLTTLLYPVAKNNTIDMRRKAGRFDGPGSPDPDDLQSPQAADSSDIETLVACLPVEKREVLLLRFVDGLRLADIAELLGIPEGTVKSRLHLGIKALREAPATREYFDR